MNSTIIILILLLLSVNGFGQSMIMNPIGNPDSIESKRERFFLNGLTSLNTTEEFSTSLQGSQK